MLVIHYPCFGKFMLYFVVFRFFHYISLSFVVLAVLRRVSSYFAVFPRTAFTASTYQYGKLDNT